MADALARVEASPLATQHEAAGLDMVRDLHGVIALAKLLGDAVGFLPSWVKTEGQAVAVLLSGRELGIPPMRAFRVLHSIEGKVELASSEMLSLLLKGGVRVEWLESDGTTARGRFTRPGFPDHVETYTLEDAKRAQLSGKGNWGKHPKAMLRARCVSAAARWWSPDLLGGNVYAEGEIAETLDDAEGAASYSPEVRELGHSLHETDPAPEGADPLASVMDALGAVQTEAGLVVWVATHYRAVASEPDSQRKRDRWKTIQHRAAGLTPPVRTEALRRMFAEHAAKAAAAAKASAPIEGETVERDPVDDLESVETREMLMTWATENTAWLGAIPRNTAEETRVWDAIRGAADKVGDRSLADTIEGLIS